MTRREALAAFLSVLAPAAPDYDLEEIIELALHSRGLKSASPEAAAWLSLVSHIRHSYTDYDSLLTDGYGVEAARHFCRDDINAVLADWGCRRRVSGEEED